MEGVTITEAVGLSYAKGPTDVPLLDITIGQAIDQARRQWPDELALVSRHQSIRWTWNELGEEVDRVACGFIALGVTAGDRVAIWAPNCAEWTVVQFATAKIGAILVTINPAYRLAELDYALNKAGCSVLVAAASFRGSNYLDMVRELGADKLPRLRSTVSLGVEEHRGFLPWAQLRAPIDPVLLAGAAVGLDPNQPINIQFTSGTTGFPKGATLTHRNILNNGYFASRTLKLTSADRICVPVPLYHCFGMVLGNLAAVTSGAAMVYPAEAFDPRHTLEAVQAEGCTALYGVPTMFIAMLSEPDLDTFQFSTLRTGIMAGSPCPVATMRGVIDRLNMREVTIAYGMTETSPLTTQTATDDPIEERVSTVGRVHPHAEAKIVAIHGTTLPLGQQGEYCARGYAVMPGYWDDPDRTAEAIDSDGWMHSGDLGTMDGQGFVRITGRLKDMVIRGGENIYPREIEEFLYGHPAIEDVTVVGVPDARMGEELCAWVRLRPGMEIDEESLRDFCRGQIAHFKIPRHIRFVTEFPTTVTGKIQKFIIRDRMIAELASADVRPGDAS